MSLMGRGGFTRFVASLIGDEAFLRARHITAREISTSFDMFNRMAREPGEESPRERWRRGALCRSLHWQQQIRDRIAGCGGVQGWCAAGSAGTWRVH